MAAYMRVNPATGNCTCLSCKRDVLWVKVTQTGKWAGIVAREDAETIVSEPYDGGRKDPSGASMGGKRDICTKVQSDAILHGCKDIREKYGKAFARFKGGNPEPATPRTPKGPAPSPPEPTPPHPFTPEPKAPEPVVVPAPEPEPKAPPLDPANPLAALQQWIEQIASSSMDEAAVQALIDKATAELAEQIKDLEPQVKTVETIIVERAEGSKVVMEGHTHPRFKVLLHLAMLRKHVFMPGPSGAGKSFMARQIADALGIAYYEILMGPADTPGKIVGFTNANGEIVSTEFRKAWLNGGLIHIEEIANGNAAALVTINAALANGHATFPDGQHAKHADFICFASDNTWGLGPSPQFPTRRPLDGANRDRFAFVEVGYDSNFEDDVALSRAKGDTTLAESWTAWVRSIREWAKNNAPSLLVTPRAVYEGIDMLVNGMPDGFTPEEWVGFVADCVLFKTPDTDLRSRVLTAHPLPSIEVKG